MSIKRLTKKGFTLIELMIVVAIIGILAAIAVPKFAEMVTKSKEASTKGSLGAVRSAISIYYGDMEGEYPANLYTGLTGANKYMAGSQGLGNFTVPKNGTNNDTNHVFVRTTDAEIEQGDTTGYDTENADKILYYVNSTNREGELFVWCIHSDTKGNRWTSY